MGFTIGEQLFSLGTALLLGVLVGLFYDGLRVVRGRIRLPLLGGLLDLLFWGAVTVALFCHALVMEDGVVRLYMAAGVFGGAAGYFLLLSPPVYGLACRLADGVAALLRLLVFPLRLVWRVCKKIGFGAKKSFHYRRKWYKINLLMREMNDSSHIARGQGGGGTAHEDKKSESADQAGGGGAAGGIGHGTAGSAKSDRPGGGPEG